MNGSLNRTFHRETVAASGVADEKVVRQHKGTGVYAGIQVEVRPLARGKGTGFAWNAGANIPARFAVAVARGVQDAISAGVLAGLELTDVCVSIEDGSYHEEDSTEAAFREVAQKATLAARRQAHPFWKLSLYAVLLVRRSMRARLKRVFHQRMVKSNLLNLNCTFQVSL
jgi:elongation factor G